MSTTIAEGRAMVKVLTRWDGTKEAYGTYMGMTQTHIQGSVETQCGRTFSYSIMVTTTSYHIESDSTHHSNSRHQVTTSVTNVQEHTKKYI